MASNTFTAAFIFLLVAKIMGHPREILVDEEGPAVKVKALHFEDDDEIMQEDVPCHMEYQVMKRVVGTCIKLGRSARGCVAGNYLHPLHPECNM